MPLSLESFGHPTLINLARRSDRLAAVTSRWPEDLNAPILFPAVDGRLVPHPPWWRAGKGAWGCYLSHVRILEDALNGGSKGPILIVEDDVYFAPQFVQKANAFLAKVPDDWDMIYLGGQHLKQPMETKVPGVWKAVNVNRTHCYAVSPQGLPEVYSWLMDWEAWASDSRVHHCDHRLGVIHGGLQTYCPPNHKWLAGQAASHSDICNSDKKNDRSWGMDEEVV